MTTFYESPQYLKGIRKIQALGPEDRAITQHLVDSLAASYAGEDMARQLQAMKAASLEKERERNLALREGSLALDTNLGEGRLNLANKAYNTERNQNITAQNLGWANMGLSALSGYSDYRNKKNLTSTLNRLAGLYK